MANASDLQQTMAHCARRYQAWRIARGRTPPGMTDATRDKTVTEGSGADPKPLPKLLAVNYVAANTMHVVSGLSGSLGLNLEQESTR